MQDNVKLLFLATAGFQAGETLRGAALVTDKDTKPLEFRCTSAIRPSNVQKILYGSTLDFHMKVDLIMKPLINSIREKPTIILVNDSILLEARPETEIGIIRLSENEEINIEASDDIENQDPSLLTSDSGNFKPIVVEAHKKFGADKKEAIEMLQDVFVRHSLLEPFERMAVALEQVHKQQEEK